MNLESQIKQYMPKLFQIRDESLNRDELRSLLGWSGFRFQLKLVSWDRWTRTVLSRCDKNGDCAIDCMSL